MNEDPNRNTVTAVPPPPPGPGRKAWAPWIIYGGPLVCLGLALFFLLKGESSAFSASWMGADGPRTYSSRGVSVVAYYLVWPASRRRSVEGAEEAGQFVALMAGQRPGAVPPLQERLDTNLRMAVMFLGVGLGVFFVARDVCRPRAGPAGQPGAHT